MFLIEQTFKFLLISLYDIDQYVQETFIEDDTKTKINVQDNNKEQNGNDQQIYFSAQELTEILNNIFKGLNTPTQNDTVQSDSKCDFSQLVSQRLSLQQQLSSQQPLKPQYVLYNMVCNKYQTLFEMQQAFSQYLTNYQSNLPNNIRFYDYLYTHTYQLIQQIQTTLNTIQKRLQYVEELLNINQTLQNTTFTDTNFTRSTLKYWEFRIKTINNFNRQVLKHIMFEVRDYYTNNTTINNTYTNSYLYSNNTSQTNVHERIDQIIQHIYNTYEPFYSEYSIL